MTVGDNYVFSHISVQKPADFSLDKGQYYEWYARKIQELMSPEEAGDESYEDIRDDEESDGEEKEAERHSRNRSIMPMRTDMKGLSS